MRHTLEAPARGRRAESSSRCRFGLESPVGALVAALVTLRLDPVKQRSAARVELDDAARGTPVAETDAEIEPA